MTTHHRAMHSPKEMHLCSPSLPRSESVSGGVRALPSLVQSELACSGCVCRKKRAVLTNDLGTSGGGVGVSAEDELAVHYKHYLLLITVTHSEPPLRRNHFMVLRSRKESQREKTSKPRIQHGTCCQDPQLSSAGSSA